jgi:glutathione peroxidase
MDNRRRMADNSRCALAFARVRDRSNPPFTELHAMNFLMNHLRALALCLCVCVLTSAALAMDEQKKEAPPAPPAPSALNFTMNNLDGKPVNLAEKYKGKVVLIVNVASACGNTPQYKQLEELHEKYGEKGLAVVGFPANNFGGQEPGTSEQIKQFCSTKYNVKFDMMEKISVKGDDKAPLYKYLTSKESGHPGEVDWNFAKFVIGKDGKVAARFAAKVKPDDATVIKAIEEELAK